MLAGFEDADGRQHLPRRPGHGGHPALRAARQHDVPVLCAVPAHDGGEEHRLRPGAGAALPKAEIATRVEEILEHRASWASSRKRKPHQLSGGQRQRVALARALVKRPKLLLLDEPLGALDKKLREHTQFELINIQEQLGVTFIVVTHDQEEAMTLASRIGVMNRGEIVQIGTPTEIYEFPTTQVRGRLHRLGEHVRGAPGRGSARPRAHPVRRARRRHLRGPRHQRRAGRRRSGRRSGRRRSTSSARRPRTRARTACTASSRRSPTWAMCRSTW